MTRYHAVMLDECGMEFGADVVAKDRSAAYDKLREDYPESRVVQLESPTEAAQREDRLRRRVAWELDNPGREGEWYPGIEDEEDLK